MKKKPKPRNQETKRTAVKVSRLKISKEAFSRIKGASDRRQEKA